MTTMIGFSIMMWFCSSLTFIVGIPLLKGDISSLHGKVFENTKDKAGYGKSMGKPVIFIGIGVFICGVVALLFPKSTGSVIALILIAVIMIIAFIWFMKIQYKYK